jgi:hypothetical protein
MGLDALSLVMGFETAFGIELEDEELEQVQTPQIAIDLILTKIDSDPHHRSDICPTQRAYYRLREAFQTVLEVPRWRVQPSSRLQYLLPKYNRQTVWEEIRDRAELPEFPSLTGCFGLSSGPHIIQQLVDWTVTNYPREFLHPDEPWTIPQVRSVVRSVVRYETGMSDFSDNDKWLFRM